MSSVPPRTEFLTLPAEIRENVYSYTAESEQEHHLEYSRDSNTHISTNMCLPLRKIRPPALIRVCKTTRQEYLPYYFKTMYFRINVDIQSSFSHDSIVDASAKSWLNSLLQSQNDLFRFRHVEFRLVDHYNPWIGACLIIRFAGHRRKYEVDFKLDQGWDIARAITRTSLKNHVICCTKQVLKRLKQACELSKDEVLDLETVGRMCDAFNTPRHLADEYVVQGSYVEDWSDEAKLLEA